MIRHMLLSALLVTLGGVASAQQAHYCDWIARADAIVEPWENHTRTFANGEVRLALLDVVEPAAGAFHILIISPPRNELGERQCLTLGMSENIGFAGARFDTLDASYDPARGLTFTMEVAVFDGDRSVPRRLDFTLNQSTGAVAATLR